MRSIMERKEFTTEHDNSQRASTSLRFAFDFHARAVLVLRDHISPTSRYAFRARPPLRVTLRSASRDVPLLADHLVFDLSHSFLPTLPAHCSYRSYVVCHSWSIASDNVSCIRSLLWFMTVFLLCQQHPRRSFRVGLELLRLLTEACDKVINQFSQLLSLSFRCVSQYSELQSAAGSGFLFIFFIPQLISDIRNDLCIMKFPA